MLSAIMERQAGGPTEELLKLYWNRADVKREVKALRRERFELLDKLKEQEGAIQRAQEQLEGLERLLTNPLAAANAMVYFQLRHLWRVGAQRLEQFGRELQTQREKRERAQLQDAEMAKRQRRLDAVKEKTGGACGEAPHGGRGAGPPRAKAREHEQHPAPVPRGRPQTTDRRARRAAGKCSRKSSRSCVRSPKRFRASRCRSRKGCRSTAGASSTPPSSRSRSTSCVHFSEHDLASLAKTSTERAVADMKFGDRRDCDRMVERIREKIEELKQQKTFADQVKRRTDLLLAEVKYRNDTDSVPSVESLQMISRTPGGPVNELEMARRASDAPLRLNVVADDYWDLLAVMR